MRKLSLVEYERTVAIGAFGVKRRRIELIRGELREMTPIGPDHSSLVDRLADWSYEKTARQQVRVRIQQPVALSRQDSEPEPDVVWAVAKSYRAAHPTAADILLLIEVSHDSLRFDCGEKAELYAEACIGEYWIVDVEAGAVKVHRDPQGGAYRTVQTFAAGQAIRPLSAPTAELSIDWLFDESA